MRNYPKIILRSVCFVFSLVCILGVSVVHAIGDPGLIKNIRSGSSSSNPVNFVSLNGELYFSANNGTNGNEFWKSDGTSEGTVLVKDIYSGGTSSDPSCLTVFKNNIYFSAKDPTHGIEFWKSDGSTDGTALLKDIRSGSSDSNPTCSVKFVTTDNYLFFTAQDNTHGTELWRTDGTADGTMMLKDICSGVACTQPNFMTSINNVVYFMEDDGGTYGGELWITDGTTNGTVLLKDIYSGDQSSWPGCFTLFNGEIYFVANDGIHGYEIWKTNGTPGGTVLAIDVLEGEDSSYPGELTIYDSNFYFTATDGIHGYELWKSDGTPGNTAMLMDIKPGAESSSEQNMLVYKDKLYLVADDGIHGFELWSTDGTTDNTTLLKDINPGGDGLMQDKYGFVVFNDILYFGANDGTHGNELWETEGTLDSTTMVSDINDHGSGITWYNFCISQGGLFFAADDGTNGYELWGMLGDPTAPDAPGGLLATNVLNTSADLSWNAPASNHSAITDYIIAYQQQGDGDNWIEIDTESADTHYSLSDLTTNTTYNFKVKAVNDVGPSNYSEIASFTPSTLSSPRNLDVSPDGLFFDLSWDAPAFNGGYSVTDYKLEYKSSSDPWDSPIFIQNESDTATSWTGLGPLQYGNTYDIKLFAINSNGDISDPAVISYTVSTASDENTHYIRNCTNNPDTDNFGLLAMKDFGYNDTYILANNIDCGPEEFVPVSFGRDSFFQGIFDGGGNAINNIHYSGGIQEYIGLFTQIGEGAVIKNLNLINDGDNSLTGPTESYIGGLAGYAQGNITVENVSSSINISENEAILVGGLFGYYYDGGGQLKILNSNVSGDIISTSADSSGGLIGYLDCEEQDFKKCAIIENTHVISNIEGNSDIGGLIGDYGDYISTGLTINNSSYEGSITTVDDFSSALGGLIGDSDFYNDGITLSISNSYTAGSIDGNDGVNIAGLVGYVDNSYDSVIEINTSHSTMTIDGRGNLGGLMGYYYTECEDYPTIPGSITNSWYSGQITGNSGHDNVGGLVGLIEDDNDGYGKFEISKSYSEGGVIGGYDIGGLVGGLYYGQFSIENSYSHMEVVGYQNIGGLVGYMYGSGPDYLASIDKSYSSGDVLGFDIINYNGGGLAGYIESNASISNSFSASYVSDFKEGQIGALIGIDDSSGTLTLSNNYFDQTKSDTDYCAGNYDEGPVDGCTPVNINNSQNDYFFNNDTNPPFTGHWSFGNIWDMTDNYPILVANSDNTKPVITLIGDSTVTVIERSVYVDAGATALDDVDGDLTDNIIVTGGVNTQIPASYHVYFDVCDMAGNCASKVTRTVIVQPLPPISVSGTQHSYPNIDRTYTGVLENDEKYGLCEWSVASGSPDVVFGSGSSLVTTAQSQNEGTHYIKLTCTNLSDGEDVISAETQLIVNKYGDINNDFLVDNDDFTLLMFNWGSSPTNPMADYTQDGIVNNDDFTILMYWWSNTSPA